MREQRLHYSAIAGRDHLGEEEFRWNEIRVVGEEQVEIAALGVAEVVVVEFGGELEEEESSPLERQ